MFFSGLKHYGVMVVKVGGTCWVVELHQMSGIEVGINQVFLYVLPR